MTRLEDLPEDEQKTLLGLPCPTYEEVAWTRPPPLAECRVALVSSAGLHRRDDPPFLGVATDYRAIPDGAPADDVIMTHISTSYDRTGYQQDLNVILPRDRLGELAAEGVIGSVAGTHYAFVGAGAPRQLETAAREVAGRLKEDDADAVLLLPV